VGKEVGEECWRLPLDSEFREMVKSTHADLTNSSGKDDGPSSQAAAFLWHFVEEGVEWIHLDIAGTGRVKSEATGFGAKVLVHYVKSSL
jgi:leucyl aminopeptidase